MMADNRAVGLTAPWQAVRRQRPSVAGGADPASNRHPAAAESAESPHCIALHGATVRYIVEEKCALTCDNAENPWSGDRRHLLCKQGVVGSSPIVSTIRADQKVLGVAAASRRGPGLPKCTRWPNACRRRIPAGPTARRSRTTMMATTTRSRVRTRTAGLRRAEASPRRRRGARVRASDRAFHDITVQPGEVGHRIGPAGGPVEILSCIAPRRR